MLQKLQDTIYLLTSFVREFHDKSVHSINDARLGVFLRIYLFVQIFKGIRYLLTSFNCAFIILKINLVRYLYQCTWIIMWEYVYLTMTCQKKRWISTNITAWEKSRTSIGQEIVHNKIIWLTFIFMIIGVTHKYWDVIMLQIFEKSWVGTLWPPVVYIGIMIFMFF